MREAFELWFDREYPMTAELTRPKYRNTSVMDLMQAAYSAGMERAAEICDAQMEREAYGHAKHAVTMCADAIRAEITKGTEHA